MLNKVLNRMFTTLLRIRGARIETGASVYAGSRVAHPQRFHLGQRSVIYRGVEVMTGPDGEFRMGCDGHIAAHVYLLIGDNRLSIGDRTAIAHGSGVFCHSNDPGGAHFEFLRNYVDRDIVIGSNVVVSAHCLVLPGTVIEDNVWVGANSLVRGHLESGWLYAGSPVRPVKPIR